MKLNTITLSKGLYSRFFSPQYLSNAEEYKMVWDAEKLKMRNNLMGAISLGIMEYIMGCNKCNTPIKDGVVRLEIVPDTFIGEGGGEVDVVFNTELKTCRVMGWLAFV